ncbi:SDR family NAD(P)-dependent oxidoreductase [Sediminivirga luteola]|uniref:SDR family NAD(P)-dependent oxidoreductase n=1 Tax=Sediminivirga luteola TaxID=1774748 RepID=UPI001F5917A8|nr:SDR family NAD(P)-dependent oxidoreductase [Sediminivirga luteola]MCI2264269.1 SDR family NAD(P)-dependent oxidoreductase [Sediminivirga luteola]
MRERQTGTIVNVTSIGGKFAGPFGGWYHATKFAVEGLSDSLRQEVAEFGVRVVIVEPGAIKTEWGDIALDSAQAASGQGPYGDRVRRMSAAMRQDGGTMTRSSEPDLVASVIMNAIQAPRPRTRYVVGHLARPAVVARWLLSDRMMDRMSARMMGD